MLEGKLKFTWKDIEEILQKDGYIFKGEEIRQMSLVKPKGIIIYLKKEEQ